MRRRFMNLFLVIALVLGFASVAATPVPAAPFEDKEAVAPPPPGAMSELARKGEDPPAAEPTSRVEYDSGEVAFAKLHPDLQDLVRSVSPGVAGEPTMQGSTDKNEPILIDIVALPTKESEPLIEAIRPFFVDGLVIPDGLSLHDEMPFQMMTGKILPSNILKVAAFSAVQEVYPMTFEKNEYDDYPADEPVETPEFGPQDWAALRAEADKIREGSLPWEEAKAFGDGREDIRPSDWYEVMPEGPHKAEEAWARGYRGEGVAVSVIDDGVDMAHPDIMGSHRIYSSTLNPQYNGWPMAFDPFSMRIWFQETLLGGTTYFSGGFEGLTYFDTSTVPDLSPCGTGLSCFDYTPLIDFNMPGTQHTYIIDSDMTMSGEVHVGTHHDGSLRDYVWGERVAVLVTDPNVAGVYDTVYVDLDNDYDFRDEKPVTQADITDLENTYNNPISYRDLDGDGIADLSGGMLYFIADGMSYPPGFDMLFYPANFGLAPPEPGDMIIMHGPWITGYSHGTQCASNVVGKGVIGAGLPDFSDADPTGATYGAAPEAYLVPMNNAYSFVSRINDRDAYVMAAFGWDEVDQNGVNWWTGPGYTDTDTILATSNSYGYSDVFNDGYDYLGQFIVAVQQVFGPYLQFLFSTGNGGPGYGTVAPPSPAFGIGVGASTQYGSTGWDTITDTDQIMFNDVAAFSNSGPGARGGSGTDVLAVGAFAAGAEELNYFTAMTYGTLDGNYSWSTWGGTSRSAPSALGNLALVYQAYKEEHGVWPTYDVAKAIFMSGSTDIQHDVFKQGAGSVNADRSTFIAGGHGGFYMDGDSATWEPGDYRGVDYPAFGHIVYPGDVFTKTFTLVNDSDTDVEVEIAPQEPVLVGVEEFDFTVTAEMVAAESAYGAENRDNFYKAFNYFIPITATAGMNSAWYNLDIPAETDMMIVRQAYPFGEFDVNGDYGWDNRFYLMVYNWKDQNNDGNVWEDKDGNGVVNFINGTVAPIHNVGVELDWDDPRTELDRWEYGRFGYNRPYANTNELIVHDPLGRMHDGLFIGTRHLFNGLAENIDTHLHYRVEFYSFEDIGWLSTDVVSATVPASGTTTFVGEVAVPADIPAGDYGAAFYVSDAEHTSVVPVVMNVAQALTDTDDDLMFAGDEAATYDADRPYNNGMTRGYFDWGWREESGDWRFFYMDIDNQPVETPAWEESFEAEIPPTGWATYDTTGNGAWITDTTAYDGNVSMYHADDSGDQDAWLVTPQFTPDTTSELVFYQNENWSSYYTYHGIWVSDGSSDPNDGDFVELEELGPGTDGAWEEVRVDLSAYDGTPIYVAFVYQGNWSDQWWVDAVRVVSTVYPLDPAAHVIVKDEWEGPAPNNDIDTIALGPSPSPLSAADFGVWNINFYNPSLFGPYTLEQVAASPDDRAGRSIWRFNTSSGANEDWIAFPLEDGLHELMQHNILFEGDQHGIVFTKTVGLLTEDVHAFAFDTYRDDGDVGSVTLESTIDLDGLAVSAYVQQVTSESWTNEPIDFVSNTTIEWAYTFEVQNGVSIEAVSSSADIADIDLYLFYLGPDGNDFQERASSTTATADESVYYANPEDGYWLVGINNWSGPAGTFNLDLEVVTEMDTAAPPLTVTGVPVGEVAADTPVTLDIAYDFPMEAGKCYQGFVNVGPLGAPQLKEIPIDICRLEQSAMLQKEVDLETAFPGNELVYTIDLFNLSDPDAYFEFSDPIPDDTEFVDLCYSFAECPVPPVGGATLLTETFDSVTAPALPTGWAIEDVSGTGNWATSTSTVHPSGNAPHSSPNLAYFNSWTVSSGTSTRLYITDTLDLSGYANVEVTFWMYHDTGYTSSNDRVQLQYSTDGGTTWINVGSAVARYDGTTGWAEHTVDISVCSGNPNVLIGFLGVSGFGNDVHIDDITISTPGVCPSEFTYDALNETVVYTGPLPLGMAYDPPAMEGFEDGIMPPLGWEVDNIVGAWEIVSTSDNADWIHSGTYAALAYWDGVEDIWLYSPWFTVDATNTDLSFWAYSATQYLGDPVDGHDVQLWAIDEDNNATLIWQMHEDEVWDDFAYREVVASLADFAGETIQLAWNYFEGPWTGYKAVFVLDDITLPGVTMPVYQPSASVEVTVEVSDTVSADDYITNTASLEATHTLAWGEETEPTATADAVTHIGTPELMNSTKTATAEVMPGEWIHYEITIVNSGDAVVNVTLTDPIPTGTTFDSADQMEFTYDDVDDQMEWTGSLAPGTEKVLSYYVQVDDDPTLWYTTINNTATLAWDGNQMDLEAETEVYPPYTLFMPLAPK